jgi:ABC-type sugar transport system permease subunit
MSDEDEEDKLKSKKPKTFQSSHFEPTMMTGYSSGSATSTPSSGVSNYIPSGSARPWTDKKWDSKDYISFLKKDDTKTRTKLKFRDKELNKIDGFTTKEGCHGYRLGKNKSFAFFESLLIIFDNILKILPLVMFSSLPLLILRNSSSENFDDNFVILIYGVMICAIIISFVLRWIFKNEWMIIEQYIIAVNKKEEEIVEGENS